AVAEIAFVGVVFAQDFTDEAADQIGVEQRPPGFLAGSSRRIAAGWNLELAELDLIRLRRSQRFANAGLFDQAADQGAGAAVDARFDPRVVADRHEARLHRTERPVSELAEKDIAIVDVHPPHASGLANHALGNEIAHRADDLAEIAADEEVGKI